MPGWPPAKNAAFTWYFVIRDADGDPVASATALDVEFSIDGGVFADVAGAEVDEGQGFYSCPISAAEMNGDAIMLMCKTSSAGAKTAAQVIYTSTRQIDNLAFPNVSGRGVDVDATGGVEITANQNVNLAQWLGIAPDALSSGKLPADVKLWLAVAPDALSSGKLAADLKLWLAVAPNALIAGRADASVGAMAANVLTASALAADAVDEIWDELMAEPAQAIPGAAPAFRTVLAYLYTALRNAITVTSSTKAFTNDAGTVVFKKALSDDGTTYTEAEAVAGP
jgi:hypothetical protein